MWSQETSAKDKDEETLAEMVQHLRLVRRGAPEEIARTAVLIGRLGDAKSLATLLTTTAAERNLNGTNSISAPASNLHTISLSLHAADSDTYKSESDLDDADDDLIPTETMPSRAQVRRSILSVINGNNARFSLSAPPQQQLQQPQPLPPSPLAALSADSASSAGSSSLKFSLLSNIKEDEEFDNSSLKSANAKQQRYQQTTTASAPVLIIPRRGQSAANNTTLLSSTPPTTNTTSPLVSSMPNLTPPSTAISSASSSTPLSSSSVDEAAAAAGTSTPPVLVRSSSLETATLVITAEENVAMEGFLVKKLNLPFGIGVTPSHAASGPGGHGHAFGWKPRYYKLKETVLEEFDSKTNAKVGSIAIRHNTIITVLQSSPHHSVTGSTAHAFIITEPRISPGPGPNLIKHTLCTHAQADRDKWVDAISARIRNASEKENEKYSGGQLGGKSLDIDRTLSSGSKRSVPKRPNDNLNSSTAAISDNIKVSERSDSLEQLSSSPPKSQILDPHTATQPQQQQQSQQPQQHSTPPPQMSQQNKTINMLQESARKGLNMVFGNNSNANNSNTAVHKKTSELEIHKNNYTPRSWLFSMTNITPPPSSSQQKSDTAIATSTATTNSTTPPIKSEPSEKGIFGKPLADSVSISRLSPTSHLSSVVSRCLEFLESPAVIAEEGIYRLSGSKLQIQALRKQFDADGDVDLVRLRDEGKEIVDVHVVTGLLKLYLRELADSVLGEGQIKLDLLKCAHLPDKSDRTKELTHLLPQLPDVNYALLKRIAQHLNLIIQNKDLNKMSINNLSIVFAPTLNVPGQLLQVMILDWETVFPK
ncbi:hypothetical protein HK100_002057 [Physocladia obscura]|uniref:RhoGAP-domain-containing protein n=1 Tax=Physocladia obscura TaxID=109957 RepID=A0AAD5SW76_9FUNG|nr:hypothetical protein HK100_002057 [Physocladia obscura]